MAGPDISVPLVNPADHLEGLRLSPEQLFRVREKVNQVHQANSGAVNAVLGRLRDTFLHVYDLSADLTFATSEHHVFFKLSGFHDNPKESCEAEDVDHLQAKSQTGSHEGRLTE